MPAFIPATLRALGNLAVTDGNIPVGNGTTWVAESGATVRSSIGLGITDTPEFLRIGVGVPSLTQRAFQTGGTLNGSTGLIGYSWVGTFGSDGTANADSFFSFPFTQNASYTLTNLYHFRAISVSKGASNTITNQTGLSIPALASATNNYGVQCAVASAAGNWGWYGNGTANNLTNGAWIFGQMTAPTPGSNQAAIYAKDNAGTAEMYVKDEANNEAQISPHPLSVMSGHKTAMTALGLTPLKCTWGYESTNDILGVKTTVDMGMVVRCVEWLMQRAGKPVSLIKETTFTPTAKWEDRQASESARYSADVAAYRQALAELVAKPIPLRPDCATPPEWKIKAPVVKPKPAWMGA